jgi:Flp pilus assembly pilin Flp
MQTIRKNLALRTSAALAAVKSFHADEEGLNIIEIILIIFIAVVILVALAAFFNQSVWAKVKDAINGLMGTSF